MITNGETQLLEFSLSVDEYLVCVIRTLGYVMCAVITFLNAHTVWHYLQMAVLLSDRTLSIECYSETSINCVLCSIVILYPLSTPL